MLGLIGEELPVTDEDDTTPPEPEEVSTAGERNGPELAPPLSLPPFDSSFMLKFFILTFTAHLGQDDLTVIF